MRPGVIVSIIGHIGAVLMTLLAWDARSNIPSTVGSVVPVEIVDVAPESNVRALAEEIPEGEVQADETAEGEPETAPTPERTPPQPRRQPNDAQEFDAFLRNFDAEKGRRRQEGERSDRTQEGAGLGTAEVAAMEDRVRALVRRHLLRCWRMPIDQPDPGRLVVTLEFELDRNGNLRGQPRVTSPRITTFDAPMRAAVDAAQRAVRTCDPYPFPEDPVVGQHYETWDQLEFTFRPPT